MTPKAFQRIALSLPEAHEEPHFERTSFRVGTKIFATMTADGKEAMVRVCAEELRSALLSEHDAVFFSYGGWTTRNGSVGVRLASADAAMIEELLRESWRSVAPKRLSRGTGTDAAEQVHSQKSGSTRKRAAQLAEERVNSSPSPKRRARTR
jgi:hypothetical protein